jgi:hypothetical protein
MRHRKKWSHPHWPSYARGLKREAKRKAESEDSDFNLLIDKAGGIGDPYYRALALAWIARQMAGAGAGGEPVFSRALRAARKVELDWRRAEVLVQVGSEMIKSGSGDFGALMGALEDIADQAHRQEAREVIHRRMARAGIRASPAKAPPARKRQDKPAQPVVKGTKNMKRITLGLVNTYRGKELRDAHIRAIARAAPLCYAFGLNLGLLAFPLEDGADAVSRVERASRVGEGRGYLRRLMEEGRLFVLETPESPALADLGEVVATTSRPDPKKKIGFEDLPGEGSFCILVGLGSQGLPGGILKRSRYHLEVTGREIALETCTAMGVLAGGLGRL